MFMFGQYVYLNKVFLFFVDVRNKAYNILETIVSTPSLLSFAHPRTSIEIQFS